MQRKTAGEFLIVTGIIAFMLAAVICASPVKESACPSDMLIGSLPLWLGGALAGGLGTWLENGQSCE